MYQPSKVNPSFTRFPVFVETVNGETEPVVKLPFPGTVPPVAPFPLYVIMLELLIQTATNAAFPSPTVKVPPAG